MSQHSHHKPPPEAVDEPLVIVPIPPLITLLRAQETAKGAPLSEEEVLAITDSAICMTMRQSHADQMAAKRGYDDIDPENVWDEWVRIRG